MKHYRLHRLAAHEIAEAVEFHNDRWAGQGDELRDAIETTILQICKMPLLGSVHLQGTRKRIVLGFRYYPIVYLDEAAEIIIIALHHSSQRPAGWVKRLSDSAPLEE